jgi:PhzF family phenazine biosynthesis protein
MVVQRLAAFTTDPIGGNPAGVVIDSEHPPEKEMQRIAAEVGYSETAFLAPVPDQARSYAVRYFSPLVEVPFCGHATIAAGVAVAERDGPGEMRFLTKAGPVPVDVRLDELGELTATLTSPTPAVEPVDDDLLSEVLAAVDWAPSDLDTRLPPARASAGAAHLVLAVRHRARLAELRYDFDRLRRIMLRAQLVTLHLVWQEDALRYHGRDPFPVGGVVEDPATGAAAAAFGAYLRHLRIVTPRCRITIIQGEDMGRPSTLLVDLVPGQESVHVSGHAVPIR